MENMDIAISTCPNDTFAFYALLNGKLKDCPFSFNVYFSDIEELNMLAFKENFSVTKISFNAFGYLTNKYILLDSGSALGDNCGPILISKNFSSINEMKNKKIGIPGEYTTANFLFSVAVNEKTEKIFMKFHEIIPAIMSGSIDAGVIIHESRFTYESFGLKKILDLGEWWQNKISLPIPLGGIAVSRKLSEETIQNLDKYLKLSIKYAYENFEEVKLYVKKYANELEDSVIESHIKLYVNDYTFSIGDIGKQALFMFMEQGVKKGLFKENNIKICKANGY